MLLKKATLANNALSFKVHHANQLKVGKAYLEKIDFDVILIDLSLPDSKGIDTFISVQKAAGNTPIVIITGIDDEDTALKMVQQGAQDYLIKAEVNAAMLARSLRYAIERKRLWLELEEKSRALQASEASRRLMIDQNVDGVLIIDQKGTIQFANPAAENIFSRNRHELVGEQFKHFSNKNKNSQLDILRSDGTRIVIEMNLAEVDWEGSKAFLASLRDITEHQQAKKELSQKANELERRNMELDAFAHTIAHQIQGLLGHIIGYTSYLEMHYGPEMGAEGQDVLHRILRSGSKMSNVVSELLLLAQVDKKDAPLVPLNMKEIVAEACKRMGFNAEERHAQIIQPDIWPDVVGYPAWIEEAWVNYISNALKYGGTPPVIELGWEQDNCGMIRFWVKDNGQGLTAHEQRKLFKRHSRLLKTKVKGEGLGLSIVQRIISKCQGEVGVDGVPGKGSIFWFTLPLFEENKQRDANAA